MARRTIAYPEPNLIYIVFSAFQHFTCMLHLVFKQKTIDGVAVNLFEAFLEFF